MEIQGNLSILNLGISRFNMLKLKKKKKKKGAELEEGAVGMSRERV